MHRVRIYFLISGYMKGKLEYEKELKVSNENEMSLQYDSLSEGKRQKC